MNQPDIDFANLDTNSVVKNHIKKLQGDGFYRPERFRSQAATDADFLRACGIEPEEL